MCSLSRYVVDAVVNTPAELSRMLLPRRPLKYCILLVPHAAQFITTRLFTLCIYTHAANCG
jgi:hypothetical protein